MKNSSAFFLLIFSTATITFGSQNTLSQKNRQDYMMQWRAAGCHLPKELRANLRINAYLFLEDGVVASNEIQPLRVSRSNALSHWDNPHCGDLVMHIDKLQIQRSNEKIMKKFQDA